MWPWLLIGLPALYAIARGKGLGVSAAPASPASTSASLPAQSSPASKGQSLATNYVPAIVWNAPPRQASSPYVAAGSGGIGAGGGLTISGSGVSGSGATKTGGYGTTL